MRCINFSDIASYIKEDPWFDSVYITADPRVVCIVAGAGIEEQLNYMMDGMSDDVLGCEEVDEGYLVSFKDTRTAEEFVDSFAS